MFSKKMSRRLIVLQGAALLAPGAHAAYASNPGIDPEKEERRDHRGGRD